MASKGSADNPSAVRGDIQKGRATGKRPGFDPAAAPLETDAEAGGKSLSDEQIRISRVTQAKVGGHNGPLSYNEAMRRPAGRAPRNRDAGLAVLVTFIILGCVALVTVTAIALDG